MAKSALPRRLFAPAPPMPDPSRPPSLIGPRFAPSPDDVSSRTLRTEKLPRRRHRARRTRSGSFPADAGPVRGAAARSRSVERETPSHGAFRSRCGDEHRRGRRHASEDGRGGRIRTCKSFRTEGFKPSTVASFVTPPSGPPAFVYDDPAHHAMRRDARICLAFWPRVSGPGPAPANAGGSRRATPPRAGQPWRASWIESARR